MRGFLLINPRSGSGGPTAEELSDEAARRGIEARILRPDDDLAELARQADAEALGMAGGDGSLAAVAAVALERELPFVCVPFGTRNHFARDLGLDRNDPIVIPGVANKVGAFGTRLMPRSALRRIVASLKA